MNGFPSRIVRIRTGSTCPFALSLSLSLSLSLFLSRVHAKSTRNHEDRLGNFNFAHELHSPHPLPLPRESYILNATMWYYLKRGSLRGWLPSLMIDLTGWVMGFFNNHWRLWHFNIFSILKFFSQMHSLKCIEWLYFKLFLEILYGI